MSAKSTVAMAATALAIAVGSSSAVFAKAHDQGVADGEATPDNTGAFVQSLGDTGVSPLFNMRQRGDVASEANSDLRVEPVVGNGANRPD